MSALEIIIGLVTVCVALVAVPVGFCALATILLADEPEVYLTDRAARRGILRG